MRQIRPFYHDLSLFEMSDPLSLNTMPSSPAMMTLWYASILWHLRNKLIAGFDTSLKAMLLANDSMMNVQHFVGLFLDGIRAPLNDHLIPIQLHEIISLSLFNNLQLFFPSWKHTVESTFVVHVTSCTEKEAFDHQLTCLLDYKSINSCFSGF